MMVGLAYRFIFFKSYVGVQFLSGLFIFRINRFTGISLGYFPYFFFSLYIFHLTNENTETHDCICRSYFFLIFPDFLRADCSPANDDCLSHCELLRLMLCQIISDFLLLARTGLR